MSAFETGDNRFLGLLFRCLAIAGVGLACIYLLVTGLADGKRQDDLLSQPLGMTIGQ